MPVEMEGNACEAVQSSRLSMIPVMCTNDMLKRVVGSKFQARLVARRELLGLDVHARGRVDRADSVNDVTAGIKAFRHCLVV